MATSLDFALFVCEQIETSFPVRYRKMFGEYVIYVNDKPLMLLCDNTVFVKKLDCVEHLLCDAPIGRPFEGAKEHYIPDVENRKLLSQVITELEKVIPVPKPKRKKETKSP